MYAGKSNNNKKCNDDHTKLLKAAELREDERLEKLKMTDCNHGTPILRTGW